MDLKGKMVKIRFKKYFETQRLWVMLGKVLNMTEGWIMIEGKGIISYVRDMKIEIEIDEQPRVLVVPSNNIAHIRVLPDNFDLTKIRLVQKKGQDFIKVENGPDTSIGEQI